jgi:hypothetical protein
MSAYAAAAWLLFVGIVLELISIFVVTPQKKKPFEELFEQLKFGEGLSVLARFLLAAAAIALLIAFLK